METQSETIFFSLKKLVKSNIYVCLISAGSYLGQITSRKRMGAQNCQRQNTGLTFSKSQNNR